MSERDPTASDVTMQVVTGMLPDEHYPRQVFISWKLPSNRMSERIDHLKFTPEEAITAGEGLIEAARDVQRRHVNIFVPQFPKI